MFKSLDFIVPIKLTTTTEVEKKERRKKKNPKESTEEVKT